MVGRTPSKLSRKEKELFRLLKHSVFCFDGDCKTCLKIETKLDDGPEHYPENPDERLRRLDVVLSALVEQSRRITAYIEKAPVSHAARVAAFELTDMSQVAHRMLTDPIYSSGRRKEARDGNAGTEDRTPRGRARKRAVTYSSGAD